MSLFKKRKANNIRERISTFSEDEEATEDLGVGKSNGNNSKAKKNKKQDKAILSGNALSFGDELEGDDGIVFQEKKSVLSYKLRKEMKKEKKEKRKEKKGGGYPSDGLKAPSGGLAQLNEMGIKIVNGREAEAIGYQGGDSDEEEMNSQSIHKFRVNDRSDSHRLTASTKADPLKDILQGGVIPDANTIHFIRKQRQQIRERGDYVSVEDTERREGSGNVTGKSCLVREEDEDKEDDEEGGQIGESRLHFSDIKKGPSASLVEARAARIMSAKSNGEDEDEIAWETQQMQKMSSLKVSDDFESGRGFSAVDTPLQQGVTSASSLSSASKLLSSRPGINYQAEGILKRLRDSRESLSGVHRRHQQEFFGLLEEREECEEALVKSESTRAEREDVLQLYQVLRGYVTDLRDCLNEKSGALEDLEQRVLALYTQQNEKLLQRRRQDVKDQTDEVSPSNLQPCPNRSRRCAEREGRRTRRRREREKKGLRQHKDGTSTDDELSTQEMQTHASKLEAIEQEARDLFSDVEEDYGSLSQVLTRFEKWRRTAPESYADAYVSNNMPIVTEVFVRLDLLLWNPLAEGVEIERMSWYSQLALYASPAPPLSLSQLSIDPDKNLLSYTIEKVVLVKLREIVKSFWDPLSHSQTVRLVNLVRHFCQCYPTIGHQCKELLSICQTVRVKLKDAIEKDVFIPIFNKPANESRTSGSSLFFQRQFWVAWKLLSQVLMWHKILSEDTIAELGIRGILNLYLIPALYFAAEVSLKDSVDKAKMLIQALPREWVKKSGSDGSAHSNLTRLVDCLVRIAQKFSDVSQSSDQMKEIYLALKSIGANRAAEEVATKYIPKNSGL